MISFNLMKLSKISSLAKYKTYLKRVPPKCRFEATLTELVER
jgi:hypothetical protein